MTHINFYVSKDEGLENRLTIAYRLINMALKNKLSIHIHTDSESTSKHLDDLLWKKDKTSFIPHLILPHSDKKLDPLSAIDKDSEFMHEITISDDYEPMHNCDYLINMSNQRPEFFSRFEKVAEIIDSSPEILSAGRKRYAFYRDRGYTLDYHQL
jgi:DNA polymerase-3 subunit chi